MAPAVWTIGHSTRTIDQFVELLATNGIEAIADVRRFPASRRLPHFGRETLAPMLEDRGVVYRWLPALGGRRAPSPDSPNTAWRNASFRGYADYMTTEEFAAGLSALVDLAAGLRTAIMCAEAVWWRCHRGLIADVLRWTGWDVTHIVGPGTTADHPYTGAARIVGGRLSYAADEPTAADATQIGLAL